MKKTITRSIKAVLVLVMVMALLSGCGLFSGEDGGATKVNRDKYDNNRELYPVYSALYSVDRKDAYVRICNAMEEFNEKEVLVGVYDTKEELDEAQDWLDITYQQIAYENPDYFWVDPNYFTYTEMEYENEYRLMVTISYTVTEAQAKSMKTEYESKIDEVVRGAEAQSALFDKVLYVYDYILENTSYDHVLAESDESCDISRSAYGCLVEGKTVCSGYALAFTAIMQELGIECGTEFNSYGEFSIISGHVWNYCKLDGEYYYFDVTWDDTALDSDEYAPYLDTAHLYFGITKDELYTSHLPLDGKAPTPACTGTKYNYYIYNGANFETYDFDSVSQYIESQSHNNYIAMRFGSFSELLSAQFDLMDDGRIYEILPDAEEVFYVTSDSNLHMIILLDN